VTTLQRSSAGVSLAPFFHAALSTGTESPFEPECSTCKSKLGKSPVVAHAARLDAVEVTRRCGLRHELESGLGTVDCAKTHLPLGSPDAA